MEIIAIISKIFSQPKHSSPFLWITTISIHLQTITRVGLTLALQKLNTLNRERQSSLDRLRGIWWWHPSMIPMVHLETQFIMCKKIIWMTLKRLIFIKKRCQINGRSLRWNIIPRINFRRNLTRMTPLNIFRCPSSIIVSNH